MSEYAKSTQARRKGGAKPPKRVGRPGSTLKAQPKPMRAMSAKRAKFVREVYAPMRDAAVGDGNEPCQIVAPGCTGHVQHLHEPLSRGRAGGLAAALRDGPPAVPACDHCNGYVSENPVWAAERGWLLHRNREERPNG